MTSQAIAALMLIASKAVILPIKYVSVTLKEIYQMINIRNRESFSTAN